MHSSFIEPMLLLRTEKLPESANWLYASNHDRVFYRRICSEFYLEFAEGVSVFAEYRTYWLSHADEVFVLELLQMMRRRLRMPADS